MSRNYDNWERLVAAVLDREKLRQLAREPSFDCLTSDFSSPRFSFDSTPDREYVPGLEAPKPFSYDELKRATRDFQPVRFLGQGGSKYDFKGWIDEHTLTAVGHGSGSAVTVKSIPEGLIPDHDEWLIGDGNLQYKVNYFGQLRHLDLVKLMGYCTEAYKRLLVYEFMPRGSLDMNLLEYEFMPRRRDPEMDSSGSRLNQTLSNWETRVDVAIGVARALSFLHERKPPVIHGHVNASTILLDEDFNAKLEVFSDEPEPGDQLATVLNRWVDTPHPNLLLDNRRPPEHLLTGKVTAKSDMYSFGVVLLQLLSGLHAFARLRIPGERNLVDWTKPRLSVERKLFRLMDPRLRNEYSKREEHVRLPQLLCCV